MSLPRILLVSLGGTITMTRGDAGGIVPTLSAADLARAAPGLDAVARIETLSPLRKPSPSLAIGDLLTLGRLLTERLAAAGPEAIDGAVVIQGTDTIEETAFLLDCVLGGDKPVVVTGAMRGPEAAGAEGPGNVLGATIVAASPDARGRGALACLNDEIHAARFVQKSHTALPSAFRSPLAGPVGLVIEGRARFHTRTERLPHLPEALDEAASDASVALVRMSVGDDGRLLAAVPGLGFAGVVIDGMGAGHVPDTVAPIVSDLVARMPVVLASRAETGPVFTRTYGFPGSEMDLVARGVIPAGALGGAKARLLLMLLLRAGLSGEAVAERFARFT